MILLSSSGFERKEDAFFTLLLTALLADTEFGVVVIAGVVCDDSEAILDPEVSLRGVSSVLLSLDRLCPLLSLKLFTRFFKVRNIVDERPDDDFRPAFKLSGLFLLPGICSSGLLSQVSTDLARTDTQSLSRHQSFVVNRRLSSFAARYRF